MPATVRDVGWITAARQFSSAFAPFGLTALTSAVGTFPGLWIIVLTGLFGIAAFATIAFMHADRSIPGATPAPERPRRSRRPWSKTAPLQRISHKLARFRCHSRNKRVEELRFERIHF